MERERWINEALPGGAPMSLVSILKCLLMLHVTSLSEIERKFFVFVGILEKGESDAL